MRQRERVFSDDKRLLLGAWRVKPTLVFDELVQEAGFPRPRAADHQELEQEVCRKSRGSRNKAVRR